MISLDKLTIFETHIDELYATEFKARVQVQAECTISDEVMRIHGPVAKASAKDGIQRNIWEQIYGGELHKQANHIRQAFILVEPAIRYDNRKDGEELRAEINKLLELLAYKP